MRERNERATVADTRDRKDTDRSDSGSRSDDYSSIDDPANEHYYREYLGADFRGDDTSDSR
jgi:hypothetical protein